MPAPTVTHPASVSEALALLAASRPPIDSPTQHRIRSEAHLRDTFADGRRRPEWVWTTTSAGSRSGLVAGYGSPQGTAQLLDVFDLPADPESARVLVRRASDDLVAGGGGEALLFAPTDMSVEDVALAPVVGPLKEAGWRLLVERRHYEFVPLAGLSQRAASYPTTLRFVRLTDPADPRLAACHREVMRDTLDAHDRALVEQVGFDEACRRSLEYLVTADPVDRIHLAYDDAGDVVGIVSGHVWPSGRGVVLFVGVCREHRGRGYGRQLLAWQTLRNLAAGAEVLVADTDNDNVPMARGFAEVGWPQTETRIDLVR
jgi:ribosomal protein S18 acetylase RimI-like enzyme